MQKWAWEHSPEESLGAVMENCLGTFLDADALRQSSIGCARSGASLPLLESQLCLLWRVTRNKALRPAKPHLFPLL